MLLKMNETDMQLLARYTRLQAEEAFAEIVHRRLPLVYSAALRQQVAARNTNPQTAELLQLRGQVGSLHQQMAANAAKASQSPRGMAALMNDPSMREYLQRALSDKLQAMYQPLMQELQLSPEQREQFIQIASQRSLLKLSQLGSPAQPAGDSSGAAQAAQEANRNFNDQLKALLGPEGYARYDAFSDEIPARSAVSQLQGQLGRNPLSPEQNARLLAIFKAEPSELMNGLAGAPDMALLGSPADGDRFLQQVAESNQRILQQAGDVLSSDQ